MKTVGILAVCLSFSVILSCVPVAGDADSFVKVENGKFVKDGKPYYFAGANMWYAAMSGFDGSGQYQGLGRGGRGQLDADESRAYPAGASRGIQ